MSLDPSGTHPAQGLENLPSSTSMLVELLKETSELG